MPATSKFLRHVLPPANTLPRGRASHGGRGLQSRTDRIDGPYRNLRDGGPAVSGKEEFDLGLYSTQTVKTNVIAEPFDHLDDDGICLRVDLEQG